jgi:hypothetical protein
MDMGLATTDSVSQEPAIFCTWHLTSRMRIEFSVSGRVQLVVLVVDFGHL